MNVLADPYFDSEEYIFCRWSQGRIGADESFERVIQPLWQVATQFRRVIQAFPGGYFFTESIEILWVLVG